MSEAPLTTDMFAEILQDQDYLETIRLLQAGRTKDEVKKLPTTPEEYKNSWHRLGLLDNNNNTLITYNEERIVPPRKIRTQLLNLLHLPHLREANTLRVARSTYWWKTMTEDVIKVVKSCKVCIQIAPTLKKEKLAEKETRLTCLLPREEIHLDYGSFKRRRILILVDRYSGYAWMEDMG